MPIKMGPTPWPDAVLVATAAETRLWRADHEAGHAVRAIAWQRPVAFITIEPDEEASGVTVHLSSPPETWSEFELLKSICITTAGKVAEQKFRQGRRPMLLEWEYQHLDAGAEMDSKLIQQYRMKLPWPDEEAVTQWQLEQVDGWVNDPEVWSSIRAVARTLNRYGTLSGLQLGTVLQRHTFRVGAPTATPPSDDHR